VNEKLTSKLVEGGKYKPPTLDKKEELMREKTRYWKDNENVVTINRVLWVKKKKDTWKRTGFRGEGHRSDD